MKKKTLFIMLSALIAMILISCPLPAPMSSSQVEDLLIPPPAPGNLRASMWMKDRIEISWDEVENADGYIIMMVDSGVYADNIRQGVFDARKQEGLDPLTKRGFMQVDTKSKGEVSSVLTNRRIVPGNHYVFSVVSYRDYGGIRKYSAASEYAEGGTIGVVNSLKELVYPTGVKISWGCPSMRSVLEFGADGEPGVLYDHYDFTVNFREVGPNTPVIAAASVGEGGSMSAMIPLKGEDLAGAPYELRPCVKADRNDATSKDTIIQYEFWVTLNVYSSAEHTPETLIGSSERNMSVIVEIWPSGLAPKVTELELDPVSHADRIDISWREPYVTGVPDYRAVYRIERQKDGESSWELLLDETMAQDAVVRDGSSCRFSDVSALSNTDYRYRVTFGYSYQTPSGGETVVMQTGEIPETPGTQHMIWVPTGVKLDAFSVIEGSEGLDAMAAISWTIPGSDDELRDAEWYVVPSRWTSIDSSVTELDPVNLTGVTISDGSVRTSFPVSIDPGLSNTLSIFSFSLGYRNGEADIRMPVELADGVVPEMGRKEQPLFEDFRASVNRVGEVELSWSPLLEKEGYARGYTYQIDDGTLIEDLPSDPVKGPDGRYRVSIGSADLPAGKTSWKFRMTVSQGPVSGSDDPDPTDVERYTNSLPITGSVLQAPVISASRGTDADKITVTVEGESDPALEYEISWAPKADAADDSAWTVMENGGFELPKGEGNRGEVISFRARARNTEQGKDAPYTDMSETADGAVFGGAGITVSAEQGLDPRAVSISWTPAMGAESYRIYRRVAVPEGQEPHEWQPHGKMTKKLSMSDNIANLGDSGMEEFIPLSEKYEYMVMPLSSAITGLDKEVSEEHRAAYDAVLGTCMENAAEGWLFMPPREQYASKGVGGNSNVLITWSEVPNATSYTIQSYTYRAVEHREEGKEPVIEYVPEYSPVEAQHVDIAEGLASGFVHRTVREDGTVLYSYEMLGTDEGRFYAIRANNGRLSIKSEFQKKFIPVTDEVGNELPSNYGYTFSTSPVKDFTADTVLVDGVYADHIRLKWKRSRGADRYGFYAVPAGSGALTEFSVDVSSLRMDERTSDGRITNGLAKNAPGYFEYDPKSDTFTLNDDSGVLRNSCYISEYSIYASCGTFRPTSLQKHSGQRQLYRQLKAEEIVNISNRMLNGIFMEANKADHVNGDWWYPDGTGVAGKKYEKIVTPFPGVRIRQYSVGWSSTFYYEENWLEFDSYRVPDTPFVAKTPSAGDRLTYAATEEAGGYIGKQALHHIGHDGKGTVLFEDPSGRFRPYKVNYVGICPDNIAGGKYNVDLGNGTQQEVQDSPDLERPF